MDITLAVTIKLYAVAVVTFFAIDLVWLGVVADGLYRRTMGHLLRDSPNWPVAIGFYLLFVAGLAYFAIAPALEAGSLQDAIVKGALYGLFTYATFDLTAWAVLRDWPARIVPVDMAWGTFLGAAVSTITWAVVDRFG